MTAPLIAGCASTRENEVAVSPQIVHSHLADKPDELRNHFYISLTQGQRNKVLNDMRLGIATMAMGRFDLAEQLFDDALLNIEAVYANNDQAKQARQIFVKEQTKDFKGEPYERVMAYFYRGLLYMRAGDYENARASFKGGMLQDAFADEEQYRADFALMPYLQAWAAKCSGNFSASDEDLNEFRALRPNAGTINKNDNVLVLVEAGSAPQKYSAGDRQSAKPRFLRFSRGSNRVGIVTVRTEGQAGLETVINRIGMAFAPNAKTPKVGAVVDGSPAALGGIKAGDEITAIDGASVAGRSLSQVGEMLRGPSSTAVTVTVRRGGKATDLTITRSDFGNASLIEDIYRQAVTRGGREFDSVLAGKAQFKDTANTVGDVALVGTAAAASYAAQSNDSNAAIAAGILLLVAAAAKAAAANAQPDADTRYWDNLPDSVYGLTLDVPSATKTVTVDFLSASGALVATKSAEIWRAGQCGLAWVTESNPEAIHPRAPNSVPINKMYQFITIPALPPPADSATLEAGAAPDPAPRSGFFDGLVKKAFATAPAPDNPASPSTDTSSD